MHGVGRSHWSSPTPSRKRCQLSTVRRCNVFTSIARRVPSPRCSRTLDDSYAEAIRRDITTVTVARLCANALYRYVAPFLAIVAAGSTSSVAELGVALAVTQICGFAVAGDRPARRPAARRRSIVIGLGRVRARRRVVAGASTGVVWFTVGLLAIATFNIVLVVGPGAWIADHVPYEQRSRVVGLNETSWALGLLVGVSAMGLVTAATSWRWGYAAAARRRRRDGRVLARARRHRRAARPPPGDAVGDAGRCGRGSVYRVARVIAVFGLMSASEALFVTFGPWLEDEFGVGRGAWRR